MRQGTTWGRVPESPTDEVMPTDAELLALWSGQSDRAALEQLIRRHGGMVLAACRRVLGNVPEADDAFQAVFLLLVRKAGSLTSPERVAGWLHGVALRVAKKARAGRTRRQGREVTMVEPVAPEPREDTQELRRVIDEELARLPDRYRLPILLCELEGMTLSAAAEQLGWPRGTVAGRLSRGRDLLKKRLKRRHNGLLLPLFFPWSELVDGRLLAATLDAATRGGPAAPPVEAGGDKAPWGRGAIGAALLAGLALLTSATLAWNGWAAPDPSPNQPVANNRPPAPCPNHCKPPAPPTRR